MADQSTQSITVAAPPADVMAVIADFPSYPEWVAAAKQVDVLQTGPDGRARRVHFVLDAGAIKDDYVLEYSWEGDSAVHWSLVGEAQVLRLMDGSYELADRGDGTTTVTYRLAVDVKFPMIGLMKRKAEKVIIDAALRGLKARVESSR